MNAAAAAAVSGLWVLLSFSLLLPHGQLCHGLGGVGDTNGISTAAEMEPSDHTSTKNDTHRESFKQTMSPMRSATPSLLPKNRQSPTTSLHSLTVTPSLSPTLSLEPVPVNMYIRAESCTNPLVDQCLETFCRCMAQMAPQVENRVPHMNGMHECKDFVNIDCYYHHYCARERVICLWNASIAYAPQFSSWNLYTSLVTGRKDGVAGGGSTNMKRNSDNSGGNKNKNNDEASAVKYHTPYKALGSAGGRMYRGGGATCSGLMEMYWNLTNITLSTNYYDTPFFIECVDYVTYIVRRNGGSMCTENLVSMYVCGPSMFPSQPLRQVDYVPLRKGSQRLLISIVAHILGNFTFSFSGSKNADEKGPSGKFYKELSSALHACFLEAIGIEGEFSMRQEDYFLVVNYNVGVSEADPWVGDVVTANALSLMVRDVSWMERAQEVINGVTDKVTLSPPIVVYEVVLEPADKHPITETCSAACKVSLTLVATLTLLVFSLLLLLCCRRPRHIYGPFDTTCESE